VEKSLQGLGDKVDAAERAKVESAVSDLRTALKGDDRNVIEKKSEALAQASAGIAQRAYAAEGGGAGAAGAGPSATAGAGDGSAAGAGAGAGREDVVDAEFEEVKDKRDARPPKTRRCRSATITRYWTYRRQRLRPRSRRPTGAWR